MTNRDKKNVTFGRVLLFLKKKLDYYFFRTKDFFWWRPAPIFLVKILFNVKKATLAKDPLFLFAYKIFRLQNKLAKKDFIDQVNNRIGFQGQEKLEHFKTSGRPLLLVMWNHPTYLAQDYGLKIHPDFVGIVSHDFQRDNMLLIRNDDSYITYRIYRLLQDKKFIVLAFDGGYGNRTIETKILGNKIFLARSYPFLVKNFKPIVFPITLHIDRSGVAQYVYGNQLFSDQEMSDLTETELIEKTVQYFTQDLIANDPTQINLRWFFERLRLGAGQTPYPR